MSRKRVVCTVALFVVIVGVATQAIAQTNRERAVALWEEAIRAKGGRERLHAIENFLISSKMQTQAPTWDDDITTTERLHVMPRKAWIYTFTPMFGASTDATVINVERMLCTRTLWPAEGGIPPVSLCLPTTPTEYLVQEPIIYLMETKWLRPVPINVRVEGKGKNQVDVIETEIGKVRVDFYLDRKTRLPKKLTTQRFIGIWSQHAERPMTIELEDYVAVDGILMPQRVTRIFEISYLAGDRRTEERARYSFNVAYNPDIFDKSIPKKVKSNDWKPLTSSKNQGR